MEKKIKDLSIQECRNLCKKYHQCNKCPLSLLDRDKWRYCGATNLLHLSKYALNKKVKVD